MKQFEHIFLWFFVGAMLWAGAKLTPPADESPDTPLFQTDAQAQISAATPVFRFPIVEDAEISGYFDHDNAAQVITFYDNRSNPSGAGFLFTCPALDEVSPGAGNSWVGCEVAADDEGSCPNDQELWYDNHHGIDYEYDPDWYTGAQCDPDRFAQVNPPIYAPAQGAVAFIGEEDPFNGNFIVLYHDLNGDENFYNDGLRSYYLHFAGNGIVVDEGQIVQEGDLLGYGNMSGLAWTPHLHFEVQRQTESGWYPVDPYGWSGSGSDPWVVPNYSLWQEVAASTSQ